MTCIGLRVTLRQNYSFLPTRLGHESALKRTWCYILQRSQKNLPLARKKNILFLAYCKFPICFPGPTHFLPVMKLGKTNIVFLSCFMFMLSLKHYITIPWHITWNNRSWSFNRVNYHVSRFVWFQLTVTSKVLSVIECLTLGLSICSSVWPWGRVRQDARLNT